MSIAEVQIKREEELQQCPLTLVSNLTRLVYNIKCITGSRHLLGSCTRHSNLTNTLKMKKVPFPSSQYIFKV